MAEKNWKEVAQAQDISEGKPFAVELSEDEQVLIFRNDGELSACGNSCTHLGAPLSDGTFSGSEVTCPFHNARFDVTSGRMIQPPALDDLPRYDIKEEDGRVFLGTAHPAEISMPSGDDARTFVVVGAGAAGQAAAETLRREGFAGRIVMITAEAERPYDRTLLSKLYLSGELDEDMLYIRDPAFYERLSIELRAQTRVKAVSPEARTVVLDSGEEIAADALLLATGSRPKALPVAGSDLPNVFLLRSLAGARQLRGAAQVASRAVVVGASFIATEAAASLRAQGVEVDVVAPETVPFERVFGQRVGGRFLKMHRDNGVRFHLGRGVSRFEGGGSVERVFLDDGTVLSADMVVVGVGVEPVIDYLTGAPVVADGAVRVDEKLELAPNVFAAGDIAALPSANGGRHRVEHWVVAERQGRHAARNMLGAGEPYRLTPFFWTRQLGTSFKYVGFAGVFDEIAYIGDVEEGSFLAGYVKDGNVIAVSSVGRGAAVNRFGERLEQGKTVRPEELESL